MRNSCTVLRFCTGVILLRECVLLSFRNLSILVYRQGVNKLLRTLYRRIKNERGMKIMTDFNNNFTVNILGYGHPAVQKAIEEAMNTGYSFGNPTGPEYELE